ncbi:hypothetical protein L226DRAFT_616221 [Lentinus tigrinus ALCF2SS1-7]|uniref:F-box domain-containing protein n=1 Tax=Lentinus tigrinus ALCF2SS1-6 TaxID=1328759 RepID=A0A5C2RU26_9APHY|nr:hypothetical protein L227DRAFT_657132 [Lentinus tigrinus ALCF2SS1-6]RPD70336.1 hypothetical protein L226DRAFT_616221 [Lentinus tigrinus ALCF2SS1-7]
MTEAGLLISPSARFATCQDLVEQTFGHYDPVRVRGDSGTLAKCARVSRMFFKPAAKLLWEDLDSWHVILNVLWKSYKIEYGEIEWIAPIDDKQWARLELYGPFVKNIDMLREDDTEGLGGAAFWAVVMRARGQPIFPQLSRVKRVDLRHMRTYEPIFLLSAALREVRFTLPVRDPNEPDFYPCKDCRDLTVHQFDETIGPFLQLLHVQSPNLVSLSINFDGHSYPSPSESKVQDMKRLRLFSALQNLHVEMSGRSLIALLNICTGLQHLVSLSLYLNDDYNMTLPKRKVNSPELPPLSTLTEFKFRGHPGYATAALEFAKTSALRTLLLIGPMNQEGWNKCLDTLSEHFSDTITTLCMTLHGGESVRFADIGARLHALPNLKHCFLEFCEDLKPEGEPSPVLLTDDDLVKAARAWPRLRKFVLSCALDEQAEAPSAESLGAFTEHCPELKTLVVPSIDASQLPAGLDEDVGRGELPELTGDWESEGFAFLGSSQEARECYDVDILVHNSK